MVRFSRRHTKIAEGRRRTEGTLRVTDDALFLGDRPLVERGRLRSAELVEDGRGVRVRAGSGVLRAHLEIEVTDRAQGEELLAALAVEPEGELGAYELDIPSKRVPAPLARLLLLPVVGLALLEAAIPGHSPIRLAIEAILAALAMVYGVWWLGRRSTATVLAGEDGIFVREGHAPLRFVRYADLDAAVDGRDVLLSSQGWSTALHAPESRFFDAEVATIGTRLAEGIEKHAGERTAPRTDALEQGARPVADWLAYLRRLAAGDAGSYRSALPSRGELVEAVTSRALDPQLRVAAAVVLRDGLTEEEEARVRVAVDGADEAVRVRLEDALDPEASEDALAEALEPATARR